MLVVFVIVFSDSDRVGRGEWSRVYDACMVVRVYLSGLRAPCMPRRCLRRLETRHPYHLGGVFWYGSSISIIIYLSLIRGRGPKWHICSQRPRIDLMTENRPHLIMTVNSHIVLPRICMKYQNFLTKIQIDSLLRVREFTYEYRVHFLPQVE